MQLRVVLWWCYGGDMVVLWWFYGGANARKGKDWHNYLGDKNVLLKKYWFIYPGLRK